MRNDQRDAAIVEVRSRVVEACLTQSKLPNGMPLDVLINDTLYHEKKRLEVDRKSPTWSQDVGFWEGVKSRLGRAGDEELRQLLTKIVGRFAEEVRGNFNAAVFNFATRVMPRALPLLLNALSPKRLFRMGIPDIGDTIHIQGNVERLRQLREQGTIILAPTHVSNLDSPVVGWSLFAMGLPPFTYGAGLNLFTNPVLSFFMRNLGAYRVDRRKTAPLYKDILKEYATISLEMGQPNLFFPAGTRVRSGKLEQRLKLGLLSSGVRAYINNLIKKKDQPNIYVVPCTLNYQLVLEAETLIHDHLKREGKSRYIITDDESSRPRKIMQFAQNLLNLDSKIMLHVGDPLDPFGNDVDEAGESLDSHGRHVDITKYVTNRAGEPTHLPQRDRVYTRESGEAVARSFKRNNIALTTNLVALTLFETLRNRSPELDLYRLLRLGDQGTGVAVTQLTKQVGHLWKVLSRKSDKGEVVIDGGTMASGDASSIVGSALRHFGTYHSKPVITRRGDRIFTEDMTLLLYYSNRLRGYGLEGHFAPGHKENI